MEIKKLDKQKYTGKRFFTDYTTSGYYDIIRTDSGFDICYKKFDRIKTIPFGDSFFNEWLDCPEAYGCFDGEELIGFAEGFLESWNNRYRINNICVFNELYRHKGVGHMLMETILNAAVKSGARMAVLETQSCNEKAIAFYKKHGFKIIGFDLYSYTNIDLQRHEVRIEMGMVI